MFNIKNYKKISSCYADEMNRLGECLKSFLSINPVKISDSISDFLFSDAKRLRPLLIFIISKMLDIKIDDNVIKLAAAIELLHSATLIHDDIIDDALLRRGMQTFNVKFDNKIAVIAGDYLVALCLEVLNTLKNPKVYSNFSKYTIKLCEGEISQFFQKYKILSLDEYIDKNTKKTSGLFLAATESLFDIASKKTDSEVKKAILEFVYKFSLAFQIKDDINNFETDENDKISSDIENGIYTIGIILLKRENPDCDIIEKLKDPECKKEALILSYSYLDKIIDDAVDIIEKLGNNVQEKEQAKRLVCFLKD